MEPPNSFTRLAICIEKSTPTPTRIEPIMTVTRDKLTLPWSITSHCMKTVNVTGVVVRIANRISLNTNPSVKTVNSKAKINDLH